VSGDYYSTGVQLALGKGDGHFKNSIIIPTGLAPNNVTATDLNGDGHVDLVIGVSENAEDIFLGNGDGTFQPRYDYNPGSSGAVPGDFNGDGKQDLIFPHGNVEYVLFGRGDGTLDGVRQFETGNTNPVESLAVGDFNHDGLDDLVTGCIFDSRVSVLLANSAGLCFI